MLVCSNPTPGQREFIRQEIEDSLDTNLAIVNSSLSSYFPTPLTELVLSYLRQFGEELLINTVRAAKTSYTVLEKIKIQILIAKGVSPYQAINILDQNILFWSGNKPLENDDEIAYDIFVSLNKKGICEIHTKIHAYRLYLLTIYNSEDLIKNLEGLLKTTEVVLLDRWPTSVAYSLVVEKIEALQSHLFKEFFKELKLTGNYRKEILFIKDKQRSQVIIRLQKIIIQIPEEIWGLEYFPQELKFSSNRVAAAKSKLDEIIDIIKNSDVRG